MTTSLDSQSDSYSIRIEALKRVREYGHAINEIQGDICLFVSARLKNMEAAIRKEIADKQKEKAKALATYKEEFAAENKVDYNPPVAGEDKPVREDSKARGLV